jgi:hypothetical protein
VPSNKSFVTHSATTTPSGCYKRDFERRHIKVIAHDPSFIGMSIMYVIDNITEFCGG